MAKLNPFTVTTKSGLKVVIRSAEPQDGAEVLDVVREIMRTSTHLLTEESEFVMTPEKEAQYLKEYLEHPDRVYLVPIVDGRIVGNFQFIAGNRRRIAHHGKIGISIVPKYQGQGVGRALMQAFLDWVETHPTIETLRLGVLSGNKAAIKMYESFGFSEEGREVRGVKMPDGTYNDSINMARPAR